MGDGAPDQDVAEALAAWAGPVLRARLVPTADSADLSGAGPLVGFCGIGRPEKFEMTLRSARADLVDLVPFDDHHPYMAADLARLQRLAEAYGAGLVTTEKDFARLPDTFRAKVRVVTVEAVLDDLPALDRLLARALGGSL
jgi:tetraacyldisaccharide 4'-kinase